MYIYIPCREIASHLESPGPVSFAPTRAAIKQHAAVMLG